MALFEVHLLRRAVETLAVMVYPPEAKMHLIAYVFGLSYYLAVPVSLVPPPVFHDAPLEALGGLLQRPRVERTLPALLEHWGSAVGSAPWLTYSGVGLFLAGNLLQLSSHRILGRLQARHSSKPGSSSSAAPEKAYSIPRGGLFELVSCPHYLAEIIVYLGLLLLTRGLLVACLMNVWVVFNLVLAARSTHAWYQKHFEDYPRARRALVPYLY